MIAWVAAALAGSAAEEVGLLATRYPAASVIVACSPVSAVSDLLAGVPLTPNLLRGGPGRALLVLSDAEQLQGYGIRLDAPVMAIAHEGEGLQALQIPFDGTAEQVRSVLTSLDPGATFDESRGELVRGEDRLRVETRGGFLHLSSGETSAASSDLVPALIERLPDVPGCVLYGGSPPASAETPVEIEGVAVFVPLKGGAPLIVRAELPAELPALLGETSAPLPIGRWQGPAPVVVTWSSPLEGLVALALSSQGGASPSATLQQLRRHVRLPGGATLVFTGDPRKGGDFGGVVGVLDERERPFKPRKLVRIGLVVWDGASRTGKDTFAGYAEQAKRMFFFQAADDGRLAFGSSPALAAAALAPTGELWVDEERLAAAREAPLTVTASSELFEAEVAVRGAERVVELALSITIAEGQRERFERSVAPMLGFVLPLVLSELREESP